MLERVFAVKGRSAAASLLSDALVGIHDEDHQRRNKTAIETILSLRPQNATQSLLAVQMLAIHHAAMRATYIATAAELSFEKTEVLTNKIRKLMRLFCQQAELLARLQGTIKQQRIIVEKVDVRDDGRVAIGVIAGDAGRT